MSRSPIALVAIVLVAVGCGSRGEPMPPLRAVPPPVPGFEIAQRGHEALVRFTPPSVIANVEGEDLPIDRIELLMLTERYPAITADMLALALDAARRDRLDAARQATASAIEAAAERARVEEARRAAETAAAEAALREGAGEAGAAAETPPPDAGEAAVDPATVSVAAEDGATTELTEAERLLRQVPRGALESWRSGNVEPETIVEAARSLGAAVDELWDALRMPTAIVDLRRAPLMPDPVAVIQQARQVARTRAYETSIPGERFLERATVVAAIPIDELGAYVSAARAELAQPLGAPSLGPVRTRYFFAVRTVTRKGREGDIGPVLSLAPVSVPLPPAGLVATVAEDGVRLRWSPPGADISGGELEQDGLAYNVYRRLLTDPRMPLLPINTAPVTGTTFVDEAMAWEQRYVYEVRALSVLPATGVDNSAEEQDQNAEQDGEGATAPTIGAAGPKKEGAATATSTVRVFDTFPPAAPRDLGAVRAGSRVTLRWSSSAASDLAGYRVYRHAAPAPGVDMRELAGEEDDASTEPDDDNTDTEAEASEAEDDAQDDEATEAADDEAAEPADDEAAEPAARRRRGNALLAAGWEMLSAVVITDLRYLDSTSSPAITWVYAVEAIDRAGNVSEPIHVLLRAEEDS